MAAPTNPYSAVTLGEIQAGKPCKQELKEKFRANNLNAFEVLLAAGVSPGDAAVAVGHRHLGPGVDGTNTITAQPQENLTVGSDGLLSWGTAEDVDPGDISFHNGLGPVTPRRIQRSNGDFHLGTKRDRLAVIGSTLAPPNKIKSAGGKGRFTCSFFAKRLSAADGVVGGVFRFGLHNGAAFIAGAFVDVAFDTDLENEYQRFFFVSDQITRPANLNLRFEWTATPDPGDWDTVSNGDIIGHLGGAMVTNGAGIAKWDISHKDGSGDTYLAAPTDDIIYWWDQGIDEVELTA